MDEKMDEKFDEDFFKKFKINDKTKKWKYYQQDNSCQPEFLTSFDNLEDAFKFGRYQIITLYEICSEDNHPEYPHVFPINEYTKVDQDIIQEQHSQSIPKNDYEIYSIPSNEDKYELIFVSSTQYCISFVSKD